MSTRKTSRKSQSSFHEGELWKTRLSEIKKSKQLRMSSKKQGYPSAMQDGFAFPLFSNERPRRATRKKARVAKIKNPSSEGRGLRRLSTKQKYKKINRTQRRKKPRKSKKRKN